jgi:hypothetical protein
MLHRMTNVLQAIKMIGGLLLLIFPFIARFRRGAPPWVRIVLPFAGMLTGIQVAITYYLNGLRIARDPEYWRVLGHWSFLSGLIVGILLSFITHTICDRISKTRMSVLGAP